MVKHFFIFAVIKTKMKLFAAILSVYVILLATLPCVDVDSCLTLQKMEVSHAATDDHSHDGDLCSPFCNCNCCVSPVLVADFAIKFDGNLYSQKNYFRYSSTTISTPCTFFWHPPKIS